MSANADCLTPHLPYLRAFAIGRLRDPEQAQELVQDTLAAAIPALRGFRGRSSMRSWLVAILKNKIADRYRELARESAFMVDTSGTDEAIEGVFAVDGSWVQAASDWCTPEQDLERTQFRDVFVRCLEALPARSREIFLRREVHGDSIPELMKQFGVSRNNLWVILHRARLRLRQELEQQWFGVAPESDGVRNFNVQSTEERE